MLESNVIEILGISIGLLVSVGISASAYFIWLHRIERDKAIKDVRREIDNIRAIELMDNVPIGELIVQKVILAGKMQELMIADSRTRSDVTLRLGSILLLAAIACPIASTWVYLVTDPLPNDTIQRIAALKNSIGDLPKDFSVSINKDWHILFGGLTFGFLCLAAARGVLSQHANAMKTYIELGRRARYFERLVSLVQITLKRDKNTTLTEQDAIKLLVNNLLNDLPVAEEKDNDESEEDTLISKLILELTKPSQAAKLTAG